MIVSITVHVFSVVGTSRPRYSFTSQKPPSLTWLAMSEPAPRATTSSSRFVSGAATSSGATIAAAVVMATVAEPTAMRSSAATSQPKISGDSASDETAAVIARADAGLIEHAAEPAAGADDQQHAGDGEERALRDGQQLRAAKAAARAENVGRDERADEQRHRRVPDKPDPRHQLFPGCGDAAPLMTVVTTVALSISAMGRSTVASVIATEGAIAFRRRRGNRAQRGAAGQQRRRQRAQEKRPGKRKGRHARNEAVEDGQAGIGAEPLDGNQRAGVRRHQAMAGRQARHQRQREREQRPAGRCGQPDDDGKEEDQPDAEEDRKADDKAHRRDGPRQRAFADGSDCGARDHRAPPDSASSAPTNVPSPMTTAMNPSVLPTPC